MHFLAFSVWVVELPNKQFCKLDKILRNFLAGKILYSLHFKRYLVMNVAILSNEVEIF